MDRYLSYLGDGNEYQYHIERDNSATTAGFFVHFKARLHDYSAGDAVNVYAFNYDPSVIAPNYWLMGLQSEYWEKHALDFGLLDKQITLTQDGYGNPYISQVISVNTDDNPANDRWVRPMSCK
jgi:hypothetical protein